MPKVSIIVPNYNHAQYLPRRFDSIFNQTYQDFEVIILDDSSTDNSREIIEEYRSHPKVSHIIYNEQNGGTSYKQWYKGIEYAKGDLVWIAESDDWCDIRFLEIIVPHFEDKDVAITYVRSQFVQSEEDVKIAQLSRLSQKHSSENFIPEQMLEGNKLYNASMLVFRRQNYIKVKDLGFTNMKLCGDWLLWLQIMHQNKIVSIPDSLNFCRRHDTNATSKFRRQGYDFLEGIKVLRLGKQFCSWRFNRKMVYLKWRDNFKIYSMNFDKGVKFKILGVFFLKEPLLFFFILYKSFRTLLRKHLV